MHRNWRRISAGWRLRRHPVQWRRTRARWQALQGSAGARPPAEKKGGGIRRLVRLDPRREQARYRTIRGCRAGAAGLRSPPPHSTPDRGSTQCSLSTPPPSRRFPVAGSTLQIPVRRVYCIGRNYAAHAVEMGHDPDREPPFFFAKQAQNIHVGERFTYPAHSSKRAPRDRTGGRAWAAAGATSRPSEALALCLRLMASGST